VLGDVAKEDVVVFALFFRAQKVEDAGVVAVAVERQKVVKDFDCVQFEHINLRHLGVFLRHRVLQVLPEAVGRRQNQPVFELRIVLVVLDEHVNFCLALHERLQQKLLVVFALCQQCLLVWLHNVEAMAKDSQQLNKLVVASREKSVIELDALQQCANFEEEFHGVLFLLVVGLVVHLLQQLVLDAVKFVAEDVFKDLLVH